MAEHNAESARMTERQRMAWPEAVARLREHYPVPESINNGWTVHYAEENRPGRGHFIDATLLDGEVFAQVLMDVYGYPNVSIATLDWLHADSNEECECEPCERARAAEDDPLTLPDMESRHA